MFNNLLQIFNNYETKILDMFGNINLVLNTVGPSTETGEKGLYMSQYMVVKIFASGMQTAEFFNDRKLMEAYLLFLREIEQSYIVFVWSGDAYTISRAWKEGM